MCIRVSSRGDHYSPLWWCCGSQIASLPYILPGLAKQDAQGNFQPWLASSYELSDDCTTVTIKLHPEATWTDGKPVTADDLVWTWELWTAPWIFGKGSPQSVAWGLAGAKEFNEGTADAIGGVTVVDEHTVSAKLDPPNCVWSINQYMEWGILPKHVFEGAAPEALQNHPFMDAPTVSSGPYKFVRYELDQFIEVERWDDWWGNAVFTQPQMTHVFFKQLIPETAIAQLEGGELDVAPVPGQEMDRISALPNVEVDRVPSLGMLAYWFNGRKPYLQDKRVRQAIDFALDKESIRKTVNFGLGKPTATTIMGPDWAVNPNVTPRPYDPAQAQTLLQEANWDPSQTLVYLLVGSAELPRQLAEVFQQFMDQVGIKVDIKTVDAAVEIDEYDKGEFDVSLIGGGEFARDPSLTANYFRSDTVWAKNWLGYGNPQLDELFKQGVATTDTTKRAEVYFQVQEILNDEVPWILLWQLEQVWGVNKQIGGFTPYVMSTSTGASLLDWFWK
jgi:ABC-type transport system substrate-binding protein